MKVLKSLTFGVMSRGSQNPVLARRSKLIHRLEQQKRLAQDANFVVTVSKWVRNEAGNKELVQLQKRVRPWWREDVLGTVGLTVRYGAKAIEFEKGKTVHRRAQQGSACRDARHRHRRREGGRAG